MPQGQKAAKVSRGESIQLLATKLQPDILPSPEESVGQLRK